MGNVFYWHVMGNSCDFWFYSVCRKTLRYYFGHSCWWFIWCAFITERQSLVTIYWITYFWSGPTKDELPIEMQLGYYVSSWGICGLIIFIILQFCFFDSAIKGALSNKKDYLYKFSKSNAIWIISSFIVGMSTPITDQIRVFQIYFIIQGYQYAIANKNVSTSCSLFLIHKKIKKHPLK